MADGPSFRQVQDSLGDRFIAAMREFIQADIPDVATLEKQKFAFVKDPDRRSAIATAFYEARWIYKAGLALLVQDQAQNAHVRCQAFLYGSVCEGSLRDLIEYGRSASLLKGTMATFRDPPRCAQPLPANAKPSWSFYHLIHIAKDEGVISELLAKRLQDLRKGRNSVHVSTSSRPDTFYLGRGRSFFQATTDLMSAAEGWHRRMNRKAGQRT